MFDYAFAAISLVLAVIMVYPLILTFRDLADAILDGSFRFADAGTAAVVLLLEIVLVITAVRAIGA